MEADVWVFQPVPEPVPIYPIYARPVSADRATIARLNGVLFLKLPDAGVETIRRGPGLLIHVAPDTQRIRNGLYIEPLPPAKEDAEIALWRQLPPVRHERDDLARDAKRVIQVLQTLVCPVLTVDIHQKGPQGALTLWKVGKQQERAVHVPVVPSGAPSFQEVQRIALELI